VVELIAVGSFGLVAGLIGGALLALKGVDGAVRSGNPIPVFGMWVRVLPVWALDRDTLFQTNYKLARLVASVLRGVNDCEAAVGNVDIAVFQIDPGSADNDAVQALAEHAVEVRRLLRESGIAKVEAE
jgi:hypothetical protein